MLFFVEKFGLVSELSTIDSRHKKILWINWAAPSLGDSLMDLSSRVLLKGRDIILLTHPKNFELYQNDNVFSAVYSDVDELKKSNSPESFDLVICDSFSPRVVWKKLKIAPSTPFIGMYGYLNGFEVHRTYFSFARMAALLGVSLSDALSGLQIAPHVVVQHPYLNRIDADVCVAVGGEWPFRTYDKWLEVVEYLSNQGYSVKLIGSSNGKHIATKITARLPEVISFVDELGLLQTLNEIKSSKIFLGCDGGLWHCATALRKQSVALFADCELFDDLGNRVTRETTDMVVESLYSPSEVSQISSKSVIKAVERLMIHDEP